MGCISTVLNLSPIVETTEEQRKWENDFFYYVSQDSLEFTPTSISRL